MEEFNKIKCSNDPLEHVYILPKKLDGKSGEIKCICKRATAKWELNEQTGKYVLTPIEAKIEIGWIGFGGSLDEFVKHGLFKPGTVIDYQWRKWHDSKEVDGDRDIMMIGHVNKSKGLCECCDIGTGIVWRYAVVMTMEALQCER